MRQQMLVDQMEKARELGADTVSVPHVAPSKNLDFRRVTSPAPRLPGATATGVWSTLIRKQDRFRSITTEALFDGFLAEAHGLGAWRAYLWERYAL